MIDTQNAWRTKECATPVQHCLPEILVMAAILARWHLHSSSKCAWDCWVGRAAVGKPFLCVGIGSTVAKVWCLWSESCFSRFPHPRHCMHLPCPGTDTLIVDDETGAQRWDGVWAKLASLAVVSLDMYFIFSKRTRNLYEISCTLCDWDATVDDWLSLWRNSCKSGRQPSHFCLEYTRYFMKRSNLHFQHYSHSPLPCFPSPFLRQYSSTLSRAPRLSTLTPSMWGQTESDSQAAMTIIGMADWANVLTRWWLPTSCQRLGGRGFESHQCLCCLVYPGFPSDAERRNIPINRVPLKSAHRCICSPPKQYVVPLAVKLLGLLSFPSCRVARRCIRQAIFLAVPYTQWIRHRTATSASSASACALVRPGRW